jgi:glutamyl-tRNA synthetase
VVIGRYAPSPTGALHLGNLRTALAAYLSARAQGGRFLLRIEDTDRARSRGDLVPRQLEDLHDIGIEWDDEAWVQSTRLGAYAVALERLRAGGHAFRCFCTRRDLREAASAPHGDASEPPYPGTCLALSADESEDRARRGVPFAWRLRVTDEDHLVEDRCLGPQRVNLARSGGAFVIHRSDGEVAYQLACAVDDSEQGITEVVRGADLLASAARQRWLLRCLGMRAPEVWAHLPLMHAPDGTRLSKRTGADDLRALAAKGMDAIAVRSHLATTLGLAAPGERPTMETLVARFDWSVVRAALGRPS